MRRDRKLWIRDFVVCFVCWLIGHWMGYWYGKMKGYYQVSLDYGHIPSTMTFKEFLTDPKTNSANPVVIIPAEMTFREFMQGAR